MAFCGLCYWLFRHYPQAARYVFVVGLSIANIIAYAHYSSPVFLYLFPCICLFASMLLPRSVTVIFSLISCFVAIAIIKNEMVATWLRVLFLIWFVCLRNLLAF